MAASKPEMIFGDLIFGDVTFGEMTFGEVAFGDLTFGEVLGNRSKVATECLVAVLSAKILITDGLEMPLLNKNAKNDIAPDFQSSPHYTHAHTMHETVFRHQT